MQDNDDAGRKKALAAADAIASTANSVRIVLLPGLPGSGDVSDWLDAGRTVAELQEICRETLAWTPEAGAPKVQGQKKPKDAMLHFECMADIDSEPVEWIWPGYIARGKLTLVAGDPGIGKSQLATDIAARITKGAPFPNTGAGAVGSVLMLSAEDGASDTLRPRLEAANSDLAKVHVLRAVEADDGKQRTFSLQADLASLGEKVTAIGDVNLVIIDPITSYMGMIDGHRTTDVRAVLEPLAAFAERHNVAVLAISHPPKATQAKALHAVTGSLAFVAAARLVFLAIEEPETTTGRRLLLAVKNNLGPKAKGLGFRLEHRIVKKGIAASRVTFDTVPVTLTADQALATAGAGTTTKALNEAVEFLKLELGEGPRTAKELKASAGEAGISWSTVRRAQEKLGIKPVKAGLNDGWEWNLPKNAPEGDQPDSEGVQFQAVSAFEDA
jgi:KaiC/GvpD/RAD55 family RecA-like ATPase